ncbi:uncharacterized protein PGTG_07471 [Puccinia graminis f. sp. tritici CRL 75-36-700-3]|uniref:Uncharacterized protein n=1 Tax=Puccinia graminis f. sp. tritici (strain CRL 75-36-700-3 / race SCCL) TaxID=418459 RepID=E3KD14_PUCGT|nr:uncharacterized protein PGTG_07471 [Puccinia graminis f. sp. tritici CRL 75-36-700-3]EFP82074.1 hypothetical protein PGTG_07471 [Puccinia graminis f. sp. tritici CRL 75-36-700-3]
MAPASDPPTSAKSTPEPSKRTKSSGVNQSNISEYSNIRRIGIQGPQKTRRIPPCYGLHRLGAQGEAEVKSHPFLANINWVNLFKSEASFVPSLIEQSLALFGSS